MQLVIESGQIPNVLTRASPFIVDKSTVSSLTNQLPFPKLARYS
jgi:hypothetical protein